MKNSIVIFGQEIELEYEKVQEIKDGILNESKGKLAKDFANIIIRLKATGRNVEDLLGWTIGTLGKCYDIEEENDIIVEDTTSWASGNANYMSE